MDGSRCHSCSTISQLRSEPEPAEEEDITDEEDGEEELERVTFTHVCAACNHKVAKHKVALKLLSNKANQSLVFSINSGSRTEDRSLGWTACCVALPRTASQSRLTTP